MQVGNAFLDQIITKYIVLLSLSAGVRLTRVGAGLFDKRI
jgi:hypothetical protein